MSPRFLATLLLAASLTAAVRARAADAAPPRFAVATAAAGPTTFVVYGDTRFTERPNVVNPYARRALVERIALERPVAVFIGGDLVYQGSDAGDYAVFKEETRHWADSGTAVFPALGNHEFRTCDAHDLEPCLANWWHTFPQLEPYRWYSVMIGSEVLVLLLDSDSALKSGSEQRRWLEAQVDSMPAAVRFLLLIMHYPPVRDPIFPRSRDEAQIAKYLAHRHQTLHARVVVIGSHIHNYERFQRDDVDYLVSGGGGAKPVPALRLFGELSHLHTSTNYHYIRFVLDGNLLTGTMVRFDAATDRGDPWTEPDHFEVRARD